MSTVIKVLRESIEFVNNSNAKVERALNQLRREGLGHLIEDGPGKDLNSFSDFEPPKKGA